MKKLRQWAAKIKRNIHILYLAFRHDRTPLPAKILSAAVVAYALSPIDLIPDFIPVLGFLDDALLLPFGILLALKLIPRQVIKECRSLAEEKVDLPGKWFAAAIVMVIWAAVIFAGWKYILQLTLTLRDIL